MRFLGEWLLWYDSKEWNRFSDAIIEYATLESSQDWTPNEIKLIHEFCERHGVECTEYYPDGLPTKYYVVGRQVPVVDDIK